MSSIRLRLAAAVLPFTLVLAACGEEKKSADAPPPTTAAAAAQSAELDPIKVEGAAGAKPSITLPAKPFTTSGPGFRVVQPGTGQQIGGEDTVSAHYMLLNAKDGKELQARFGKDVVGLSMRDETLQPAIRAALVGQKVGARVLVAIPAKEAVGEKGNPQMGIGASDTLLFYFDVTATKTPLKEATGTPVPPKAGLPTVTMGKTPTDPATFTLPKGAPPKETIVQPLIQGKGPKVAAKQRVRVTYTGIKWSDPTKPFDYSGKNSKQGYAEFPVGQGGLIKAWDEGIVGQPVGSRLLLVVPPKDGYGDKGEPRAGIKGTDTLVFVIDILDAN